MSLVLEALRRVERPESQPGAVGVTLSSFKPVRRRGNLRFLFFGIVAGGVLVFLLGPASRERSLPPIPVTPQVARASVPAAVVSQSAALPATARNTPGLARKNETRGVESPGRVEAAASAGGPKTSPLAIAPRTLAPAFVLQAISERDGHPVAIINDRLMKEGEMMNGVRVLRIGPETVDVLLMNGQREVVRFAPPPPDATPLPRN